MIATKIKSLASLTTQTSHKRFCQKCVNNFLSYLRMKSETQKHNVLSKNS